MTAVVIAASLALLVAAALLVIHAERRAVDARAREDRARDERRAVEERAREEREHQADLQRAHDLARDQTDDALTRYLHERMYLRLTDGTQLSGVLTLVTKASLELAAVRAVVGTVWQDAAAGHTVVDRGRVTYHQHVAQVIEHGVAEPQAPPAEQIGQGL